MNSPVVGSILLYHLQASKYLTLIFQLLFIRPWIFRVPYFGEHVIIGANTKYGNNMDISNSVIGDNVKIGNKVKIQNSYVFSNTVIEDSCSIISSVIGPNCTIRKGCNVTTGSILGKGVTLSQNLSVEDTLVQATKPDFCE